MNSLMIDSSSNAPLIWPLIISAIVLLAAALVHVFARTDAARRAKQRMLAESKWQAHYSVLEALAANPDTPNELIELALWFSRQFKDARFAIAYQYVEHRRASKAGRSAKASPDLKASGAFGGVVANGFAALERLLECGKLEPVDLFIEAFETGVDAMKDEFLSPRIRALKASRWSKRDNQMMVVSFARDRVQGLRSLKPRLVRPRR